MGAGAGQKSRLTLSAAFWTKPHVICLDEPTNYLDMDTVDQLSKSLSLCAGTQSAFESASVFLRYGALGMVIDNFHEE